MGAGVRTLSIHELEQVTAVPRGTIYRYIADGLLPSSVDTGQGTGRYTEEHARLLSEIRRLRRHGVSLKTIREHLISGGSLLSSEAVDLAAMREDELRSRILEVATKQFSTKGYQKTGMIDIIAELEMAPSTVYRFFPSKRLLFTESIRTLIGSATTAAESATPGADDFVTKNLGRATGLLRVGATGSEALTFARAEALVEDDGLRDTLKRAYSDWLDPIVKDLESLAATDKETSILNPAFVSYIVAGSAEALMMRMSWDEQYTELDYFWAMAFVLTALKAVLVNQHGLKDSVLALSDSVNGLVDKWTETRPPAPGEKADSASRPSRSG